MITYARTTPDRILQLRHQVLRPGMSIAEVMFSEDQDKATRHYGAFNDTEQAICCVTLILSTWKGKPAWWLRAMATAPGWRNQRIGTRIIRYLLEDLQESDLSKPIWCNARVESAKFYRSLGWQEVSEWFTNGNAGLSVRMLRRIKPTTGKPPSSRGTIEDKQFNFHGEVGRLPKAIGPYVWQGISFRFSL